jgi:uncharacterized protein (DUF885 family)
MEAVMFWLMSLALLQAGSCGYKAPPKAPAEPERAAEVDMNLNEEAVRGVQDVVLRQLLHDHWEFTMYESPIWATQIGDHRFDDRIGDNSPAGRDRRDKARDAFAARAAELSAKSLTPTEQGTLAMLRESLQADQETSVCRFAEWNVSPRNNALGSINYLAELHKIPKPEDGANLLARYKQLENFVNQDVVNLRLGLERGATPNAESLRLTLSMLDRELEKPLAEWPLLLPTKEADSAWSEQESAPFVEELSALVDGEIRDALTSYRSFLRDELLPAARDAEHAGVWALPDGAACYSALVRKFTTLPKTADEIHETGLEELERIHAYTVELGEGVFETSDLQEIFERLRTDPELYFGTSEEVQAKAESALAAAEAEMSNWFGTVPRAPCVVKPVPDFEAPFTTIAYYRGPSADGERPGTYYVNVYAPETRPRHEAEVLAFHEAIPGHHLQIAIAQELEQMPAFRRHMGMTAYVEGWALYTEQLSDEMGLYSGDVDRLGMASFELWRASRLVVDTGLHAKGWTREQAVEFMIENTPLAANNIRNEVDRYITTPGQALSYKTGQLEIWRLRRWAESELGERFDIKGFHDVVLGGGAISLPMLQRRVEAWVKAQVDG